MKWLLVDPRFDLTGVNNGEISSNAGYEKLAYVSGFCNVEKCPATRRQRILISRFQVRILGGSLEKVLLRVANKEAPIRRQPIYEARRSRFLAVPGMDARELARHYTSSEADPGA